MDFLLKYGPYFLAVVMGGGLIYILFSLVTATASVAADEVLAIFLDVNDRDLHLFSGHKTGKSVGGADPDRLIQHYFITAEGTSYYHELFSHSLTTAMGSGEYQGYVSLKESIVDSAALQESLAKLSTKLNQRLALGERISRNNDFLYVIDENREIQIKKTEKLYTRQLMVLYIDAKSKRVLWKVKI
ncbi:MAG: hypothetical protein WDO15_24590 [Bacteroidota bacterium]